MEAASKTKPSLYSRLQARFARTGDSEPEQAIKIRLTIGLAVIMYFCLPWDEAESFIEALLSTPSLITLTYYSGALLIVAAIMLNPAPSPLRRIFGIFLDLTSLSILMFYAGDESVFLFVLYIWVILGNGFRFGTLYLYISLFVGILGFGTAVFVGDYWQLEHHKPIGLSLMLLLLMIPLYSAFLINKLHAAIKTAKLANEAKSRFLANMSHELRTPLNGVIGIADLLAETPLSLQQLEFVDIMRNSANTLLGLIENVLDISKIEAGKINITRESFDLHQLVNSIIQMQSPMGVVKGLEVCCSIDSNTPFAVQGDPQHLRQVLINLLGNAIKFTDEGTVKLLLKSVDNSDDEVSVRFIVEDTGIGIPEEALATIFDDFTQAQSSNSSKYQGTGLGTTISKQLVELMGGEIGVESQLGQGTKFWFDIKFKTVSGEDVSLSDEKVLILASDASASAIKDSLNIWGVPHQFAASSAQALSDLMKGIEDFTPYSILLIEQSSMLEIDPVKYAQLIKSEPKLEHLSLILLNSTVSATSDAELNRHYISSVADIHDRRLLFNALHAAQTVYHPDAKIVKLADHYAAQGEPGKLNILIAEDNQVNQKVLQGILTNVGHQITMASSGEEALDLLTESIDELDMLILDMNMPGYSGVEILQSIGFMNTSRKIPVIMLTADATPEAKQKCINAGADVFLTKPLNSRLLLEEIAKISARIQASSQQSSEPKPADDWIDHTLLKELESLGDNKEFIKTLIDSFKADGLKHLAVINDAVENDYLSYRESLHALKGSATEMGAKKMAQLCLQAESLKPHQINSSEMLQLKDAINDAFHATLAIFSESVKESNLQRTINPD